MPDLTALMEAATADARSEILAAIQSTGHSPAGDSVGHGEIRLRDSEPAPAAPEAHPGVAAEDPPSAATVEAPAAAAEDAPEAGSVGHGRIRLR